MKLGKIGKLNQKEARELAKLWLAKDIRWCEYDQPHNCTFNFTPQNAHRHKKRFYLGKPDELRWSYKQVLRLCQVAHDEIEYDREKTKLLFSRLRGEE